MDLHTRFAQILSDARLTDDGSDEDALIAEYGCDNAPEAIYLLADKFGWNALYKLLTATLRADKHDYWDTAQTVIFYAASDHRNGIRQCPMPADFTIALLYHRFPDGIDDGDRIWSIVCNLKEIGHGANYDPMQDPGVLREMKRITCT